MHLLQHRNVRCFCRNCDTGTALLFFGGGCHKWIHSPLKGTLHTRERALCYMNVFSLPFVEVLPLGFGACAVMDSVLCWVDAVRTQFPVYTGTMPDPDATCPRCNGPASVGSYCDDRQQVPGPRGSSRAMVLQSLPATGTGDMSDGVDGRRHSDCLSCLTAAAIN
jgi:hypothetical protein